MDAIRLELAAARGAMASMNATLTTFFFHSSSELFWSSPFLSQQEQWLAEVCQIVKAAAVLQQQSLWVSIASLLLGPLDHSWQLLA